MTLIDRMLIFLKHSKAWINQVGLASLLIITPLLVFPFGIFPFVAFGLAVVITLWRWAVLGWPKIHNEDVLLFIFFVMTLLGYFISVDRSLSWPRLCNIALGVIIFVELRRSLHPETQAIWIAIGLALIGVGLAGVSLVGTDWQQVRIIDLPWLYDHLPTLVRGLPHSGALQNYGDLFGPRWVGITMGVLAPIYLPMLAWREKRWVRWLAGGAFILVTVTLLLTQSLQGLLALLAGTFLVLIYINRWFWALLPLGILGIVALVIKSDPVHLATTLLSIDNSMGIAVVLRLDMWSRAWSMIKDMPFTGIGLNTFPLIQSQFYPGYLIGPEAHAHNLYLQLALDLGLPGLIAFIWFITSWIVKLVRGLAKMPVSNDRLLSISALAGIIAYLAHGVMDAQMPGAKPGFVVWALMGIGAAQYDYQTIVHPDKNRHIVYASLILPLILGLFLLIKPSSAFMNLGVVQAHRSLYPFPAKTLDSNALLQDAKDHLEKALSLDPSLKQAYLLLGRIASLEGNYSTAFDHYQKRVALDNQTSLISYNLPQYFLYKLTQQTPPEPAIELLKIYHHWNNRFPNRAEGYVLNSILVSEYQGNLVAGQNYLQAGVNVGSQPIGLLMFLLQ